MGSLTLSLLLGSGLLGYRLLSYQGPPLAISLPPGQPASQASPLLPKISLNRASVQALQTLEGIGPVRAQAIVDYRLQHGPFKSIEEVDQVRGIGPVTLEKIRGRLTLD
ncbi:MAG: helix-hairpin-helix domain-containing protein [Chloroflexi bacterium]|nr:helix-hairpin-helix domain-containing protein [Chloroflexota bacterium]